MNILEDFLNDLNLAELLPDRYMATKRPVLWSPRSPDITLTDFYLKDEVYKNR